MDSRSVVYYVASFSSVLYSFKDNTLCYFVYVWSNLVAVVVRVIAIIVALVMVVVVVAVMVVVVVILVVTVVVLSMLMVSVMV